jgi:hypothetical protein
MSLSNPTAKNPAVRFMQWRGGEEGGGRLTWYDKETKQENEVTLPFSFIVLDELVTLTGFNDSQQSGYWSNEVRNGSNATLVARTKQGVQARGSYQQIKEMGLNGLKYAQSVYVSFKDESGELAIGNIKMAGSAMSAWIDFKKQYDVSQCAVYITDEPKKAKKGRNTYFVPVFEGQNLNDSTKAEAVKLDEELQQYLTTYLKRQPEDDDGGVTEEDDGPAANDKTYNVPEFDSDKKAAPKKEDVVIEDLDAKTDDAEADEEPAAEEPKKPAPKKAGNLKDVAF